MVSEGSTSGVSLMPTVHLGSLKPERTKHGKRTLDMLDVCVCVCSAACNFVGFRRS